MKSRSSHQQSIIRNYYQNRDKLMVQNLSELVSELYLAETERKRDALWRRVEKALRNLKINDSQVARIMSSRSLEALAKVVGRTF